MTTWILCIAGAYLAGSIPFGVIIGRACGVDIRAHGSRNIGATNVGRVLGRRFGLLCFLLDMGKGAVSVLVAGMVNGTLGASPFSLTVGTMWLWLAVAVAALLGHMWSVFLGFRGGKGVATAFGGLVAMWPLLTIPSLVTLLAWVVVVRASRIISLASMVAAAALPIGTVAWLLTRQRPDAMTTAEALAHVSPPVIAALAIAALVLIRHRSNIKRLLRGEEPRIGASS